MTHISFSALKIWKECPYKHKKIYVDGIKGFEGNIYTAFGTAIHSTCESVLLKTKVDAQKKFSQEFFKEIDLLSENIKNDLNDKSIKEMLGQGKKLAPLAIPALNEYFGKEYELISVEEKLFEPIMEFADSKYDFKGFIDLVIKTPDGKYHIIDWKTCSWGWRAQKKNDKMTTYQLTLYKHYFAIKHNIDPSKIETYFALLKRTSSTNQVEIFRVTSGEEKTKNALKLLNKALYNVHRKNYIKNRLSCKTPFGWCEFYKTKHCT